MSAKKFLDHLESQGFVDERVIAEYRKKVNNAKSKITPEAVAKLLVDKGHLSKHLATKAIGEVRKAGEEDALMAGHGDDDDEVVMLEDASGGGGLAPQPAPPAAAPSAPAAAPPGGLTPLEPTSADAGLTPLDDGGLTPLDAAAAPGMDAGMGGLDDLMNDPMANPSAAANPLAPAKKKGLFGGGGGARKKPVGVGPQKRGSQGFNSLLFFLVTGALLSIILIGAFLYLSLTKGTAADIFNAAEQDYNTEAYSQAVDKYNMFLKKYPNDENGSLARVRIGMARIWQNAGDPNSALDSARQVLPTIEEEEAFNEARPELATILPEVASKFADRAKNAGDIDEKAKYVAKTEEAMELVNNPTYLPTTLRKQVGATLKVVNETVEIARRVINRDKELMATVSGMQQATDSGDTAKAYELREKLLQTYPGLEAHEQLIKAVQSITKREQALVKNDAPALQPLTEDLPRTSDAQAALAAKSGGSIPGLENQVVAVVAGGAVYALKASDGSLLWRRYIGPDARSQPVRVSPEIDADLLINDETRHELVRVQSKTGKLVWRVPIGQAFQGPVVKEESAFVSTQAGSVISVDLETGKATSQAVTPMAFSTPAGFGANRPQVYQVGDHTNMYVFGEQDMTCNEVFYLGHLQGSVQAPPVMLLGHLFVAENAGADYSQLHVLATNKQGLQLRQVQRLRLKGRVVVPMLITGRRLVVVTDLGCIYVLDIDTANKEEPVANAVKPLILQQPKIAYSFVDRGLLWIGDNRFTRYDIQVSRSELSRKWVKLQGHDFVAPLQQFGDAIVGVRSPGGSTGVTVSAINGETGEEAWKSTLAAPPGKVLVDPQGKVYQISSRAGLFEITQESWSSGLGGQPISQASGDLTGQAYRHAIEMDNGRLALFSPTGPQRMLIYDPSAAGAAVQIRQIEAAADPATAPVYAAGGLVAPLVNGEVILIDPATGKNLVRPFHPKLAAGARVQWRRPCAVGDNVILADDRQNLYRLGVSTKGAAHLAQMSQVTLEEKIASPLAAAGETVYAVSRGEKDTVLTFEAKTLAKGKTFELKGRVIWGPQRVGDVVFVVSDRDGLLCFEDGQKQRWAAKLATPYLAGAPTPLGGDFLVAAYDGTVVRLSGADGSEVAKTQINEPIAAAPVANGEQLLLAGGDGTMHSIELPQ